MTNATSKSNLTGGCACSAVRYRLTAEPMFTHCCHCTQCQHLTGSAFALNTIIENDRIELASGKIVMTPGPSENGRPHDIYRCETCSTAMWSDYGGRPNYRFIRVGTLDEPGTMQPDVHIFVRSKLAWVKIPEGQKSFDIFYDTEKEWPAEMLARRTAALNI